MMNLPQPHAPAATEPLFHDAAPTTPATRRAIERPARIAPPAPPPSHVDLSQPLVDADVIAGLLCVKRKRIYELARRPDDPLPSVRIGRAVRFVRAQVEAWAANQTLH
jgi:predicted DNA-binding transcriptional regulator AlpA